MQKIRGSVAKVKMQVNLTQERPHHVWLVFDDNQDVSGDGQWLEVMYEDLPTYCTHCKHLGHEEYYCSIRKREEQEKRKVVPKITHNTENHTANKTERVKETQNQQEQIIQGQNKDQNTKQKMVEQNKRE